MDLSMKFKLSDEIYPEKLFNFTTIFMPKKLREIKIYRRSQKLAQDILCPICALIKPQKLICRGNNKAKSIIASSIIPGYYTSNKNYH